MITCVGIGPGDLGYLTQRGAHIVASAEVVAGFSAVIDLVRPIVPVQAQILAMAYRDQSEKLTALAAAHRSGRRCVVVFMGDVHFSGFQLLERVERACGHAVETVPGISSAQILASRARVCFDETSFITFHRRGEVEPFKRHLVHCLRDARNAIVIPRPWDLMPRHIAGYLLENGVSPAHPVEVWENLSARKRRGKGPSENARPSSAT